MASLEFSTPDPGDLVWVQFSQFSRKIPALYLRDVFAGERVYDQLLDVWLVLKVDAVLCCCTDTGKFFHAGKRHLHLAAGSPAKALSVISRANQHTKSWEMETAAALLQMTLDWYHTCYVLNFASG